MCVIKDICFILLNLFPYIHTLLHFVTFFSAFKECFERLE